MKIKEYKYKNYTIEKHIGGWVGKRNKKTYIIRNPKGDVTQSEYTYNGTNCDTLSWAKSKVNEDIEEVKAAPKVTCMLCPNDPEVGKSYCIKCLDVIKTPEFVENLALLKKDIAEGTFLGRKLPILNKFNKEKKEDKSL
jgi:hypothetical protein